MKTRTKKLLSLLLVTVMGASLLVGCGGKSSDEGDTDKTTGGDNEIVFWNIGTEEVDKAIYDKAIEMFAESTDTDYTITSVPVQNDTYKEKLVIAMSSGECPDMYINWSGGPMNEYIESGYAQPITDLFNDSELPDRLLDASIAQATYKDDIYAVPFMNVSLSGIFYNKEMFEKYDLEVPTTIEELEAVSDTFVKNGITPFALANAPKWTGSMYFMNLAARKGGLEPFNAAVDGSGTFEDECFIWAGDKILEWEEKGYFPEGVNSLSEDDGQARQMLYQETAAMDLIGSWYTGLIQQDSPEFYEKIGWFPFPGLEGSDVDDSIMIGTIGDNFISFNCKDDKLAAAFECATKFSEDEMVDFMVESGKVPPVKGVENKLTDPITKSIMEAANNASSTQLWYDQYLPPAVAQAHLDTSQELFGGTMTSKDAAKKFQEAMQEYLDEAN
ncbi:raffinose/stachyose/melibiose transport system substrate-binding protein [Lachnospiraceae bacterium PM6-15]|uniref:Extracellular solute-binding protein n=1 Tax=Ohessyouella blattaphilus TaxID=2949333 RepID=A0ABT1EJW7_9FIRM|nr:extracellular solute-binding protein [Ohessyouella blattaphilus]MCP1110052.1 extracellular solute-binding protein [Ohessyouella blattaphilus]MCR8563446.1 extracellular solute-binding protein [Ohessyouella blattaphilus]